MTTLYKYTTLESALAIIENNSIGFSCAENLNDPFELKGASYLLGGSKSDGSSGAFNNLSRKFGILSLTRTHLNPIMWSLYSNQHRGVVVAFDVEKAGFNSRSLIPSHKGNVIYSKTHPKNVFETEQGDYSELYELCKKHCYSELTEKEKMLVSMFFLHKSDWWFHEEEVRVVKNLENSGMHHSDEVKNYQNQSGEWTKVPADNRPLHCLRLPEGAISQVYVGANMGKHYGSQTEEHRHMIKKLLAANAPVSSIKIKKHSWDLEDGYFYDKDGRVIVND